MHWHDGRPFTADDVILTWEFAADPAAYRDIDRIERIDDLTVRVVFKEPPARPFEIRDDS